MHSPVESQEALLHSSKGDGPSSPSDRPCKSGCQLRLYTRELQMRDAMPIHIWLLEHAKSLGIKAGSAFRASAGFGSGPSVHLVEASDEDQGELVVVEFNVAEGDIKTLLESLADGRLRIPFSIQTMEWSRGDSA